MLTSGIVGASDPRTTLLPGESVSGGELTLLCLHAAVAHAVPKRTWRRPRFARAQESSRRPTHSELGEQFRGCLATGPGDSIPIRRNRRETHGRRDQEFFPANPPLLVAEDCVISIEGCAPARGRTRLIAKSLVRRGRPTGASGVQERARRSCENVS